jgi:hypothetical protein
LIAFAVIYGLLGLSFSALWVRIIGVIASRSSNLRYDMVEALMENRGRPHSSADHLSHLCVFAWSGKYHIGTYIRCSLEA